MTSRKKDNQDRKNRHDESVEGHKWVGVDADSEQVVSEDESVEGHVVNHRPLDNGPDTHDFRAR